MQVQELIEKINEATDIREMGTTFSLINEKITENLLKEIKIDKISRKVEKTDDLSKIAFLLEQAGKERFGFKKALERELDFEKIGRKIRGSPSLGTMLLIRQFSEDLMSKLIGEIGLDAIKDKIEKESSTWAIGHIIKTVKDTSLTLGRKLVRDLNLETLSGIIKEEVNVWGIRTCLKEILSIDPVTWGTLVEKLDTSSLAKKVENTNATEISKLLEVISVNGEKGAELVKQLNLNRITQRINETDDILSLIHLLENFTKLDEKTGRKLLEKLDLEILAQKINDNTKTIRKYALTSLKGKPGVEPLLERIKTSLRD